MKVCSRCHIEKDESEFHKNKHHKTDGLHYNCKACRRLEVGSNLSKSLNKIRCKKWKDKNENYIKDYSKKYVEELRNGYVKRNLVLKGLDKGVIEKYPFIIEKEKLDILIHRSHKLKKQKS